MMFAKKLHDVLADGDANADDREAANFSIHLASLTATKTADGLIDPKLVLAWLLSSLGAPGYLIGALVPVRESGALLPQLAIAGAVERRAHRKWVWALGSAVQGGAALGIAAAALLLEGAVAGWAMLGFLAVLAVARSACSASYKDVLSRTVAKGTRGTVTGSAGTAAAVAALGFAAALSTGLIPREPVWIACAIAVAGVLWLASAVLFLRLDEPVADTGGRGERGLARLVEPLAEDGELRRYLATRLLLISTALAPPFLVMLSASGEEARIGNLGLMLIASSGASILSSYVWGRLADRSSRFTLAVAGAAAAVVFAIAGAVGLATGGIGGPWAAMGFIFVAQIAYEGARAGRKTHLTDMDTGERKAVYTALSNTIVGLMLLAGGAFGLLADAAGAEWVLVVFAAMAAAGGVVALSLSEVQET